MRSFRPAPGAKTVNIDVAAASANVQFTSLGGEQQIRVMNAGSAVAWIEWGTDNTVAATLANSMPIAANSVEVLTPPACKYVWVAAIAAGATGKIYFTPGQGI